MPTKNPWKKFHVHETNTIEGKILELEAYTNELEKYIVILENKLIALEEA